MPLPKDNPSRWTKGVSGNPNGRPKRVFNAAEELRVQLLEVDQDDAKKRTRGQIMVAKLIDSATGKINGTPSYRATNEILDRLLGKPPQAIAVSDVTEETREQLIRNILDNAKALRQERDDEPPSTLVQ